MPCSKCKRLEAAHFWQSTAQTVHLRTAFPKPDIAPAFTQVHFLNALEHSRILDHKEELHEAKSPAPPAPPSRKPKRSPRRSQLRRTRKRRRRSQRHRGGLAVGEAPRIAVEDAHVDSQAQSNCPAIPPHCKSQKRFIRRLVWHCPVFAGKASMHPSRPLERSSW